MFTRSPGLHLRLGTVTTGSAGVGNSVEAAGRAGAGSAAAGATSSSAAGAGWVHPRAAGVSRTGYRAAMEPPVSCADHRHRRKGPLPAKQSVRKAAHLCDTARHHLQFSLPQSRKLSLYARTYRLAPKRRSTHFARGFKRLGADYLYQLARIACFQAKAKNHRRSRPQVQCRGVPPLEPQRCRKAFVVIGNPDAAFKHLVRCKMLESSMESRMTTNLL